MGAWLLPMFGSSLTFAIADVLCDVVIVERAPAGSEESGANDDGDDERELPEQISEAEAELQPILPPSEHRNGDAAELSPGRSSKRARSSSTVSTPRAGSLEVAEAEGLTGEQDTAMAGFVNVTGLIAVFSYWYLRASNVSVGMLNSELGTLPGGATEESEDAPGEVFVWGPTTHIQFWAALAGGVLTFLHYFLLLKAFEGASSTVLLPLVQVASVATLLGSAGISLLRHEAWITGRHLCAYALLFVGGVLPACDGQLKALLRMQFWRQTFVWCTILSELTLGAHDLMLNACSYHGSAPGREVDEDGNDALATGSSSSWSDSFQFFFYSRIAFCFTFAALFACNARLLSQLHALLLGTVPAKFIVLSLFSEGLTVLGFYLASLAYALFYQAAIVHAAEASMSQLLNLLIAFVLHRACRIGRASAASGLRVKLASFILVTAGLFLCGEDGQGTLRRR